MKLEKQTQFVAFKEGDKFVDFFKNTCEKHFEQYALEDTPFVVMCADFDTEIQTVNGPDIMAFRDYHYGKIRLKDSGAYYNMIYLNYDIADELEVKYNSFLAMGDLLSHQYEKFITNKITNNIEFMIRDTIACLFASLMINKESGDYVNVYNTIFSGNGIELEEIIKSPELDSSEKFTLVKDFCALCYGKNKRIGDYWTCRPKHKALFGIITNIEECWIDIFDTLISKKKLTKKQKGNLETLYNKFINWFGDTKDIEYNEEEFEKETEDVE